MIINLAMSLILRATHNGNSDINIVGVSDSAVVEDAMKRMLGGSYTNYQYHTEPLLDITNVPSDLCEKADVVICSDVLEHIPRPVSPAFNGLRALLKPSGWLVLTVPHSSGGDTVEHFPVLSNTQIVRDETGGEYSYRGIDSNNEERTFGSLVFHGGEGHTLEHRVFSLEGIRSDLVNAGFHDIQQITINLDFFGLNWEPWSRPWIARRPA